MPHQGPSVSPTHPRGPTFAWIPTRQLIPSPNQQQHCTPTADRRCTASVAKHEKQHYNVVSNSAWYTNVPKRTQPIPCSSRITGGSNRKTVCCAFSYKTFSEFVHLLFHCFDSVFSICTMTYLLQGISALPRPITNSHVASIGRVSAGIPRPAWKRAHVVVHPCHYPKIRVDFSNPSASQLADGPTFRSTSSLDFPGAKRATAPYFQRQTRSSKWLTSSLPEATCPHRTSSNCFRTGS